MNNAYCDLATAERYDTGRNLPPQTHTLWLDALLSSIPKNEIKRILDLGCGTGRFTAGLGEAFDCSVVGVEPSLAMLQVAEARNDATVEWKQGRSESIPLSDQSVDLVFMSQVFHHLEEPEGALREIHRVLSRSGYLAIRNGTREHNRELLWLRFFPAAATIEDRRTPSQSELERAVCDQSFSLVSQRTIHQLFADSYREYFEKIRQRALSSLIAISDLDFQAGLKGFRDWVNAQPENQPVYEPVDLFVFQKKAVDVPGRNV